MSSVAPTRLSWMVPLATSRSLNCTLARRLPGVLWSALVTTINLPSMITAWPLRTSLARMVAYLSKKIRGGEPYTLGVRRSNRVPDEKAPDENGSRRGKRVFVLSVALHLCWLTFVADAWRGERSPTPAGKSPSVRERAHQVLPKEAA